MRHEQRRQREHGAALVEIEEHVEDREHQHLHGDADQIDREQLQVQPRDPDVVEQPGPGQQQHQHGDALDLEDLGHPAPHRQRQAIAPPADLGQRLAAADRVEEGVVRLGEVGLDAHQEDRHARQDRQVGEEDRQVVDDRRAQRPQHRLRRRRREPEDQLVDPDPDVVEEAGHRQAQVGATRDRESRTRPADRSGSARPPAPASGTAARSGRPGSPASSPASPNGRSASAADERHEVAGQERAHHARGTP